MTGTGAGVEGWSRAAMAARLAQDIPEGWAVNLGIGLPTLVADAIPTGREVLLQSENGLLGMGPKPAPDAIDPWLINAGKQAVTMLPGGSFFDHATSFAMIRGGHLDLCVLGAFEVAANGDIANWTVDVHAGIPAVGGAMDLAVGAARVWVLTEHQTRDGGRKLLERCMLPLTAPGAVDRIYTNLAVLEVMRDRRAFRLIEAAPGVSVEHLRAATGGPLLIEAAA